MKQLDAKNYQKDAEHLIENRQSFEICGVAMEDMLDVCGYLEQEIERRYLKCRIYTKNRAVAGLSGLLVPAWGIASLVSIAAHNLMTYDPDYEISRDIANNRIGAIYKR